MLFHTYVHTHEASHNLLLHLLPSPQVVAVVENIVQASNITIGGGADVANSAEFNQIMRFVKVGGLSTFPSHACICTSKLCHERGSWEALARGWLCLQPFSRAQTVSRETGT